MAVSAESGPVAAEPDPSSPAEVAQLLRHPESLRCVYQPVVDLRTGECVGYEALTRVAGWPGRSPQPWFTAAARSGLAGPLEAAALSNAIAGSAERTSGQFLAVNVTAVLLGDTAVHEVLASSGSPSSLVVEPSWPADALADADPGPALERLRARGVLVSCDVRDGGRADLDRLHRWNPDVITLDTTLVSGCHQDPVRDRVIRVVVQVADEMGAVVLAEGLEGLDDARHLQRVGVRLAQGWLVGRPRPSLTPPPGQVATWLQATWQETIAATRLGRLVTTLPTVEARGAGTAWAAELNDDGVLVALVDQGGERVPAAGLMRFRAAQDIRSAAIRILAARADRRVHGLVAIADDDGRFVGVADSDLILREVLAGGDRGMPLGRRPGT